MKVTLGCQELTTAFQWAGPWWLRAEEESATEERLLPGLPGALQGQSLVCCALGPWAGSLRDVAGDWPPRYWKHSAPWVGPQLPKETGRQGKARMVRMDRGPWWEGFGPLCSPSPLCSPGEPFR